MSWFCHKAAKLLDFHRSLHVLQRWMHSKVNVLWVYLFFFHSGVFPNQNC